MSFSRIRLIIVLFALVGSMPQLRAAKDSIPALAKDAGRIVIYRDALMSPQKKPVVLLDGTETSPIKTRTYFQIDRPAGNYAIALSGESAAPIDVALTPGQTIYVCINVHNSVDGTAELYPKLTDKATATRELTACKYTPPENASAAPAPPSPLRVLLTFKGHPFEEEKFFALWNVWQQQGLLTYQRCPLPDDAVLLQPSATDNFDVIVMYDMVLEISPEQQQALITLLEKGIGVVSLHHNLAAHEKWPLWSQVIGGKFLHDTETIDGKTYEKSTYEHDVWMKIGVPDPHHPITRGVEPFYIFDETYGKTYRAPDIQPVLTTDRAGNDREIAWTHWFGNSPIFYFQLGHDSHAWTHPLYQKILLQGMRWAAEEAAQRRANATR